MEKNLIVLETEKLQLNDENKKTLLEKFSGYFQNAEKLTNEAKLIKVENVNQIDKMNQARKLRLKIKNVRLNVETTRKILKEESLKKGKAIDGIANVIKFLIDEPEKYLKKQENFIVYQKKRELFLLGEKRKAALLQYDYDIGDIDIANWSEVAYQILIENNKAKYEQIKANEKKIELELLEKEKQEKIEQEKIKLENEKLKKEAIEKEKIFKLEKEKQNKLQTEYEAKLKKETIEKEKIQVELQKKKDFEENLKRELEKKRQLELKKQKDIEIAPDKEKLKILADNIININLPEIKNEKIKEILTCVQDKLNDINNYIKKQIINL